MQPARVEGEGTEAEQLRDRIWTYAQRGVVMAVVFFAGLFVGYQLWGQATQLQEKVDELTERTQSLVKERDTERSKVTLIDRDKKELERQLDELKSKLAAAGGGAAAPAGSEKAAAPEGVTVE
jgi:low affinity Fe/Cu permease